MATPAGRQGPGDMPRALLTALELRLLRRAGGVLPGEHRAPGVGSGTELAQLRPYQPGDDVRHLDPAASARTGVPHVRVHVPERILTTWLVLDVSPSMAFGTAQRLKADVAEGVVLAAAHLAVRRGGRVALATAGGPEARVVAPHGGRGAIVGVRRVLEEGVAVDGHHDPDALTNTMRRVARLARAPGLVVIVSDFREEAGFERPLRALGARHGVIAVEVLDPREASLPAVGHLAVVDPETGRLVEVDTASRRLRERYAQAEHERRAGVGDALRRAGAQHVTLSTEGDWLRELGRRMR